MGNPDYTLVVEEPPAADGRSRSDLRANLVEAAKMSGTWVVVATYTAKETARTTTRHLRSGRKTPNRPAGTWEFRWGTREGGYGVWALHTPQE